MADKNILEQMLGHLVNEDKQKAEELFHEYVVAKSREIYESLIEAEMDDEEDDEVEEASEEDKDEDEKVDEEFEDISYEGDDEMPDMGGDPTDDLEGEMGSDEGDDEMADKEPAELLQDLDAIVDELQAKFDAMNGDDMGGDDMGGDDMGGDDKMKDDFDLETVREYVEKVPAGHGAEKKGQSEKADGSAGGLKFSKNDMGGTTANILSGKNGADGGESGAAGGKMRGSALSDTSAKEDNAGNINVPGAKNGNAFSKKEPGHGAEKAGAKEQADKGAGSLFRGRR
jgi:hypothetical protein